MDALLEAAKGLPEMPMDCEDSSSRIEAAHNDEIMRETSAPPLTVASILECEEQIINHSDEIDMRSSVLVEGTGEEAIVIEVEDDTALVAGVASLDARENISDSAACVVSLDLGELTSNSATKNDGIDSDIGTEDSRNEIATEVQRDMSSCAADSDFKKTEAFSKLQNVLANAKKQMTSIGANSARTSSEKLSTAVGPIIIDLEKENSERGMGSQTPKLKSVSSFKKVLLPNPTSSAGKLINIQIKNKDQKIAKNITASPAAQIKSVNLLNKQNIEKKTSFILSKNQLTKQSPEKKMPLILPKPVSNPNPATPRNLQKITVPKNYVLVHTDKGLVFMHSDEVPKGAVQATSTQSNRVLNFTRNVSFSNTIDSKSVGIKNASTTFNQTRPLLTSLINKTNTSPDDKNTPCSSLQMYPVVLNSPNLVGQKMRVTTTKVYQSKPPNEERSLKKGVIIDGCRHPVCTQYRIKVMEELRSRLHNRDRKLKSTRMGRERNVKRAAREVQTIKSLERQRELYAALDSFPDSLCKTLIRSQLKPSEGVRAKRLCQEEVNRFVTRLHSISPQAYDIVREVFNKVLPEAKSISSWSFGENEVSVLETVPGGRAGNSGEEADSDSDSEGDEEMAEE